MPWFNYEPQSFNSNLRQENAIPYSGFVRPRNNTRRNGLYYPGEVDGRVFPTGAGFFSNQPQGPGTPPGVPPPDDASIGFGGTSWEIVKNGRRDWATGGAFPVGSWTAPTGHTVGHYSARFKHAPVAMFDEWMGDVSYAVVRNHESRGYPARPSPSIGTSGAGGADDTDLNGYLHVGMPRMLHNFSGPGRYAAGAARDEYWLSQMVGTVEGWERWKNSDPHRSFYPLTFCHVDALPTDEARVRAHANDSRFKGRGIYYEAGNERHSNVYDSPGGGNLGGGSIVGFTAQYANWIRTTDSTANVTSPSTTEMGPSAEAGLRAFWGHPTIQALDLDGMMLHIYNLHQGDTATGIMGVETLVQVRKDLGLTMPMLASEAGNMMHSEHGKGVPGKQSQQLLLDYFLWELLGYLDPAPISASKETRTEFHNTNGGFWDHPGWIQGNGPYLIVPQLLAHSQELFGMAQKPVGRLDFGADDNRLAIGLEHRNPATDAGVLAILSEPRNTELRLQIPGGANQSVLLVDSNHNEHTVALDANGIATFSRAIVEEAPEDGRTALYIRLAPGMGSPVRVESDKRRWGSRIPDASLLLDTNGGSVGATKLASVGKAETWNNPVGFNRDMAVDDATGVWRTEVSLDDPGAPAEGLWAAATFGARRVRCVRAVQPPPWQASSIVRAAVFEVKVDGEWVAFGDAINNVAHTTPRAIRSVIYNGMTEQLGDFNRVWYGIVPDGVVATGARFRATDITAGPCMTFDEYTGLGAKLPLLSSTTSSAWPPRVANTAVVTPVPNVQADNPNGFGDVQLTTTDALVGYWVGPRSLWLQDLAVFATSAATGGGGGGTFTPPPDLIAPPSGYYWQPLG